MEMARQTELSALSNPARNRVWRLSRQPQGAIGDDTLHLCDEAIPEPGAGEFLVSLEYLSLDAGNRVWVSSPDQQAPPLAVGAPMIGIVCGTVMTSNHPDFPPGTRVGGLGQWADYQIGNPQTMKRMRDDLPLPLAEAFGTFALVGPTAYFGLLELGAPVAGETVVVSAAAGAVGSIVGQIAKIKGCRVVGIAGSDEKCNWIREELGFDAAINYREEHLPKALAATCPEGIDIYFDNVGGTVLDCCLKEMKRFGRIPTCGLISLYNSPVPVPGPYNYPLIMTRSLRIQGFLATDYTERYPEAYAALGRWMAEGRLKVRMDVVEGLENALPALKKLYHGGNKGKAMVRVHAPA